VRRFDHGQRGATGAFAHSGVQVPAVKMSQFACLSVRTASPRQVTQITVGQLRRSLVGVLKGAHETGAEQRH
jgi:hypothetical protein